MKNQLENYNRELIEQIYQKERVGEMDMEGKVEKKVSKDIEVLEEYKKLVNFIQFIASNKQYTLSISSTLSGEGVTHTSVNLSKAIAQMLMADVLLIDVNLSRPAVHKYFGRSLTPGLLEIIEGKILAENVLKNSELPNLYVLPAGHPTPDSSKLIRSEKMLFLLEELKSRFNYIILDCPAFLVNADASVLSSFADGVLLVVKAGVTSRELISKALSQLKEREKVIGVVLNEVESYIPEWLSRFLK
jgi:capsular exopolysaccharide synthesis family protein